MKDANFPKKPASTEPDEIIEDLPCDAIDAEQPELQTDDTPDAVHDVTEQPAMLHAPDTPEVVPDGAPAAAEVDDKRAKPEIVCGPGLLNLCIKQAEQCLAETGQHYAHGSNIVVVTNDALTGEGVLRPLCRDTLPVELDGLADWYKETARGMARAHPPRRVCSALLKAPQFTHLLPLRGLAHQPFMRDDGEVCATEGYDPDTGLYASFGGLRFQVEDVNHADAEDCLSVLEGLLDEFPFATPHDRSAALCALLTAALRSSLDSAPMFLVRAHQAGTGKSYLSRLITAFATAKRPKPQQFPVSDEECGKVLVSALRLAPPVLEFDNVKGTLKDHESLCAALTADQYQGRELGYSRMTAVSTRTLMLASGNNVAIVSDLTRRCVPIDLDAGMDSPATRTFSNPGLVEEVLANRALYVSLALMVVRGWIVAGCPRAAVPPLASYSRWSDWCRQPLLWLGRPDPVETVFKSMADDPERATLRAFINEVEGQFGTNCFMVKEVIARAMDTSKAGWEDLRDVLIEVTGDQGTINRKRLGHWVGQHHGRVVQGRKIVKAPVTRNAAVWQIEKVSSS
jgi:hypothetical protein